MWTCLFWQISWRRKKASTQRRRSIPATGQSRGLVYPIRHHELQRPTALLQGFKELHPSARKAVRSVKRARGSTRTKGGKVYKHSLMVGMMKMTGIRQAKGSTGALEPQSWSLNEQTGASEEQGESQTLVLVKRGRSLPWLLPDPGLPNQSKLTETSTPPLKGRSPFKLSSEVPSLCLSQSDFWQCRETCGGKGD